jgi:hypothetical protein
MLRFPYALLRAARILEQQIRLRRAGIGKNFPQKFCSHRFGLLFC